MRTCFVVQGFGTKTDYRTGRALNLDRSYAVIKEAVEAAELRCVRADEIMHSQVIDRPMYQQLLEADLVVADLSTSNANAIYELGVRHAVRPHATIIVAEKQWDFPFDINRNLVLTYEHLGSDLGLQEYRRFVTLLKDRIQAILPARETDSPLYTFVPELQPPQCTDAAVVETPPESLGLAAKVLTDQAEEAISRNDFLTAKALLEQARRIRPNDESLSRRLAFSTYKSKVPGIAESLQAARDILAEQLDAENSNDPETLGLWGAVHKRLWQHTHTPRFLDLARSALERGFLLRKDAYSGINLAFVMNERAQLPEAAVEESIADFVGARRVRLQVTGICRAQLGTPVDKPLDRYWVLATLWEAAVGLSDNTQAEQWERETLAFAKQERLPEWALTSTRTQIGQLQALLEPSPLRHIV